MDMCNDWPIRMLRSMILAHKPASIIVNEWMAKELLYVIHPGPKRGSLPPLPPLNSWQLVLFNFDGVWLIEDRTAVQPIRLQGFLGEYSEIPRREAEQVMMPYYKRVVDERADLNHKMVKLEMFIETPAFMAVEQVQQLLMRRQLEIMRQYHEILTQRIVAFDKPQGAKP